MEKIMQNNYVDFLGEIKERIRRAQYDALKAVNKELIVLYWDIGRMIIKRQNQYDWGKSVVENLAKDLQQEFSGILGFSKDNLWRMREFYIRMTKKFGWTKNVLIHQIDNKTYEKTMLNQTNFSKVLPEKIRNQAKLAVKDEYTFDFLELGEEHTEIEKVKSIFVF